MKLITYFGSFELLLDNLNVLCGPVSFKLSKFNRS